MKKVWLAILLVLAVAAASCASFKNQEIQASRPEKLLFVHIQEENSAAKQVQAGDLDIYFWRIPPELADTISSDKNVKVIKSPGGSQSILLNPAPTQNFNPFTLKEVRYAINFLVDREFIVNDVLKGYGLPMESAYGPFVPDYLTVLDTVNGFNIKYNPALAQEMIINALTGAGAQKTEGKWSYGGRPVVVKFFIRSDDPKRKATGELLAQELEKIGFVVERINGDLNKAFNVIYGADPKDGGWHLYTEGWGSSAFTKYDTTLTAQMYAPWYGSMPGQGEPTFWNYQNSQLDKITEKIVKGEFSSKEERDRLLNEALNLGIQESVRIFVVSLIDPYLVNNNLEGVVNDFGAGATGKFTITNMAKTGGEKGLVKIGMKQIFQGAWNPIGGFTDWYSTRIQQALFDPASWANPHTGDVLPFRAEWRVETAGPNGELSIHPEAILWDPRKNEWKTSVEHGFAKAKSKVVYKLKYSNWHHGLPMSRADILFGEYFMREWGTNEGPGDLTVDPEYTNRVGPLLNTFRGFRFIDDSTVEVYIDYWHFDEGYIADYGTMWASTPWELMTAMEKAVLDNKVTFSKSAGKAKNVDWLSLITPSHVQMLKENILGFTKEETIPDALKGVVSNETAKARYQASLKWLEERGHAVVGNGQYFLEAVDTQARTVSLKAFNDPTYPFKLGLWDRFNEVNVAEIKKVAAPDIIRQGEPLVITATVEVGNKLSSAAMVHYWILNTKGKTISNGIAAASRTGFYVISQKSIETAILTPGTYTVKIFAVSPEAVKPSIAEVRFLILEK